jgi:hypothetical protein
VCPTRRRSLVTNPPSSPTKPKSLRARTQKAGLAKCSGPHKKATESLHRYGPNGETIRPSHWRYSHAKIELVERGISPTVVNIARVLGIHRVAVYQFRARYPWLDDWVNGLARDAAVEQFGLILKRHTDLAIQGSVASADLVHKIHAGHYTRGAAGAETFGAAHGAVQVVNNILVPRPDYGASPVSSSSPAGAGSAASNVPVVSVR